MEVFGSAPEMQDKRTVRLGSASPAQPVGEAELNAGVDVTSKDSVNSFGARDTLKSATTVTRSIG